MIEIAPDAPDWDEYEAEQERARRHRKKLAAIYDAMSGLEKKRR